MDNTDHIEKTGLDKLIRELEESAEMCDIQLPYNVPVSIRSLNKGIHKGHIDKNTYDTMLERIRSTTDKFKKKCNCRGIRDTPIRETHPEKIMGRIQSLKGSVESCRTDAPSMAFMAAGSLGTHTGYIYNDPLYVTKGLREILNIAVEFKGCSCNRYDK